MVDHPLPRSILGISLGTFITRLVYAALMSLITYFVFYYIPSRLLPNFGGQYANILSYGDLFFYYALLIVLLEGIQIVFKGTYLGDGAGIFNGVAQIFYIYLITSGGVLTINLASQGFDVSIDFRTILYLMLIPSALSIVSSIVNASSRSSVTRTKNVEEIVLN